VSFSSDVKDELFRKNSSARHCQIAEIAAIVGTCGKIMISATDTYMIRVSTENTLAARKYYVMLKQTFGIHPEIVIKGSDRPAKTNLYSIIVRKDQDARKMLQALKLINDHDGLTDDFSLVNPLLIQQTCCKRAFIRGMFLTAGSISDPNKFYHFEIVCANEDKATQLQGIINSFDLGAKLVKRKKNYVVYVKEGSQIVELLNIMEAHVSLMNLENIRIVKGVKNNVNRQVNCETANLNKVVAAAVKQTEDIRYIEQTVGLDSLDESLEELARVRLEHSDTPLKDLGQYLSQPLGKSGVNHRLKKISEIAEKIRNDRKESL
jgi:hypothetical protein